jgi:hypothetical protein
VPKSAKKTSTPVAVRQALAAIARHFSAGSDAVIETKSGTTPMGSTMKSTAGMAMRKVLHITHTVKRSFHTIFTASRKIFRLIFDCPTRRSSKTMGISLMVKPRLRAR